MRNPQEQLTLVSIVLMLIGSGCSRDPCSLNHKPVDQGNSLKNHCQAKSESVHLICSGGLDDEWKNGSDTVRILTLCRLSDESFDPEGILIKFPAIRNLSISNSNLTRLAAAFPSSAKDLHNVTFNGTKLKELVEKAFSKLPALRVLDLRNNALTIIDPKAIAGPSLEDVYLSGNPWKCATEISWILNVSSGEIASRIVDRDELICTMLYFERPLVPMIEIIEELREQCLKMGPCICNLSHVHRNLVSFVTINCTSRNLTEMPEFLPKNTTIVDLSKNQEAVRTWFVANDLYDVWKSEITFRTDLHVYSIFLSPWLTIFKNHIHDMSPLKMNPYYKKVKDVYLDYNEVESIAILESSEWLDQFRALSLRGNRLTDLPPYALENALQQNRGASGIYLGKNPWRCDCHFTPGFQDLLRRHINLFKDAGDITCAKVEDDENSEKQITHLTRTAICTLPADWIQPLDVLNGVLASLIFFVFGKLLYDYWNFKRTGKLPWIVAKIP